MAASETGWVPSYGPGPRACCCLLLWGGEPLLVPAGPALGCSEPGTGLYVISFTSLLIILKLRSWAANKPHYFPEELPLMQMRGIHILSAFLFRIYGCVRRELAVV